MPAHDIIDNRKEKLVDHINRILSSTQSARFAVGYFFLSGLECISKSLAAVVAIQERRTVLRHGGAVSGFNAFNAIIPSTRSAVVLLCNKDGGLGSLPDTLLALLLKAESNVPKVAGLPVLDAVKKTFAQFQTGTVDRTQFAEEFNLYLSDERLAGAPQRLKTLGPPKNAAVLQIRERGGMEVTTTRLSFDKKSLDVLMYRTPEGRIEQFFINEH